MILNRNIFLFIALVSLFSGATAASRTPKGFDNGIAHRWEFRTAVGGQFGTPKDQALLFDVGTGYNFNNTFYFGVATGIYPFFGTAYQVDPAAVIPVLGDISVRLLPQNENCSFFLQARTGVLLQTQKSYLITAKDQNLNYDRQNYFTFEVGPGFIYRVKRNIDLRMSVNYAFAKPGDDGCVPVRNYTEHLVQFRLGLGLRGKPKSPTRSEMLEIANQAKEESEQQYLNSIAAQRVKDEEARQRAKKEREEQRRQRENNVTQNASQTDDAPVEFYCHVTPEMMDDEKFDNLLISLASQVAGKQIQSIVVLGYAPQGVASDNVLAANDSAEKVRTYLARHYVINKNLISAVFYGFESSSSQNTKPKNAIATIMVKKAPEKKK